jgi:hypothetical protein
LPEEQPQRADQENQERDPCRYTRIATAEDFWYVSGQGKSFQRKVLAALRRLKMRIERLIVIADGASWIRDFYSTDLALYDQRRANCQFNGAGIVEKENDLLVARRQKHRGMQWVPNGADVICTLRTLWFNGQWETYWNTGLTRLCAPTG